jgi:hypothetical protein
MNTNISKYFEELLEPLVEEGVVGEDFTSQADFLGVALSTYSRIRHGKISLTFNKATQFAEKICKHRTELSSEAVVQNMIGVDKIKFRSSHAIHQILTLPELMTKISDYADKSLLIFQFSDFTGVNVGDPYYSTLKKVSSLVRAGMSVAFFNENLASKQKGGLEQELQLPANSLQLNFDYGQKTLEVREEMIKHDIQSTFKSLRGLTGDSVDQIGSIGDVKLYERPALNAPSIVFPAYRAVHFRITQGDERIKHQSFQIFEQEQKQFCMPIDFQHQRGAKNGFQQFLPISLFFSKNNRLPSQNDIETLGLNEWIEYKPETTSQF